MTETTYDPYIVRAIKEEIEELRAEVERLATQNARIDELRHEAEMERDKYRKQVVLGFKHLVETPVLTDEEIQEGYTVVEHLRMALAKALEERDAYRSVAEGEPLDAYQAVSEELAASQAREQQLRDGLIKVAIAWSSKGRYDFLLVNGILESTPTDDTALRAWGANLLREMADNCGGPNDLRRMAEELESNYQKIPGTAGNYVTIPEKMPEMDEWSGDTLVRLKGLP